MKQKMVIKVSANCEKCRKKAMQVAAVADGVISVALEGDFRDKLVVIGDGVDAACLVAALRKKACHATLQSLEEVKPPPPKDEGKPKDGGNAEGKPKDGGGNAEGKPKDGGGNAEGKPKDGGGNAEKKPKSGGDGDSGIKEPPHCPYFCYCHQQQPPFEMYRVVYDSYGPTTGCFVM